MAGQSIFIYRLFDPRVLVANAGRIAALLFGDSGRRNRRFHISAISGCLFFSDDERVRPRGGASGVPTSADDAKFAAQRFLTDANRKIAGELAAAGVPPLFQAQLKPMGAAPVYVSGSSSPVHWVCSFLPFLATGNSQPNFPPECPTPEPSPRGTIVPPAPNTIAPGRLPSPSVAITQPAASPLAPVSGGRIDVRIGAGGAVVGLWSQWRPYQRAELVKCLPPPPSRSDHGNGEQAVLYYGLGGEEEPQDVMAPFYRVFGHAPEHGATYPASEFSLMVEIVALESSDSITLSAQVFGGVGSLRYAWGCWRLELGPAAGFQFVGTSSSVQLPQGAYNVVLDVADEVTGAFARTQEVIYFLPPASLS